jgi:tRNA pseudouridine55 synthase
LSIDGILNVNKPSGKTSFAVVSMIRKLSGQRRVGHAGTLDPIATGVLHVAQIQLGIATDTYDTCGKVTQKGDPSPVTGEKLAGVLNSFRGPIEQNPPIYSAVRHQGKHLYELARAGIEVEKKARRAEIFRLEILNFQSPLITLEVECSKGTYIRSLAHDLGQVLGCGAHLRNLVRTRYGLFSIEDALPLPELENAFYHGYWQNLLFPIDAALLHRGAAIISEESEQAVRNGKPLTLEEGVATSFPIHHQARCRVYTLDGHFLAVLGFRSEKGLWHPDKVFPGKEN